MNIMGLIRAMLYHAGYYQWKFRRLLGLENTKVGHIHFSIHSPENIQIHSKLIGGSRTDSESVRIRQSDQSSIYLGHNSVIRRGVSISATGSGKIHVGEGSIIGKGTTIETYGKAGVTIGNKCRISWYCLFLPSDEHVIQIDGKDAQFEDDIVVGDHVWIGARVLVLKGTQIGDHCVVAAGSICKGIYPPNSLIAGVPAKVIKSNVNWRNLEAWEIKGRELQLEG